MAAELSDGTGSDAGAPRLVRAIGRWGLTAVIINSVVGSGIFGLPSTVAGLTGSWSPLAFLFAATGVLTVVLCFAEVGSRFDQTGGPYLYARETYGEQVGFQVGWLNIWTRVLSGAAVLNVFLAYLAQLVPAVASPWGRAVAMTVAIALVTLNNVIGVRQGSWTVNALTLAKLLPLVLLGFFGLLRLSDETLASQAVAAPRWTEAILVLVFAYGGFESGVIAGGETRNPRGDTAFALVMGILCVSVVYCLVQLAVVGVLPQAASNPAPVAGALRVLLGPAGLVLGSLAAVVSTYGWLAGFSLMTPRLLYSMGERRELPSLLGRVHPRFRTPHVAIVANSLVTLAVAVGGTFAGSAALSVGTRLIVYALTCAALPLLRARGTGDPPGFRLPAGVPIAALGIAFCVWLFASSSSERMWMLLAIVLLGVLLRRLGASRRTSGGRGSA
jgi:amino acid transporter